MAASVRDVIKSRVPRISQSQPGLTIYSQQTPVVEGLVIDTGYSTITLLSTVEGYPGWAGRGVGLGGGLAQLTDAYGRPDYLALGRQGMYHVYGRAPASAARRPRTQAA